MLLLREPRERIMRLECIIFFEDMRLECIIFLERLGAIISDLPEDVPEDMPPPIEPPPIPPDWARTGADSRARVAASNRVFFIVVLLGSLRRAAQPQAL
jgi:hypothetical protein